MMGRRMLTEKSFSIALRGLYRRLPERAIVACSGGVDSVALLDLVCARYARAGRVAGVLGVHLDHGQRSPAEATRERETVEALCRARGAQFHFKRLELKVGASEAQMRRARYRALAEVGVQLGGRGVVFTAHHADDDLETCLLKVLRGTHPSALRGIPARAVWKASGEAPLRLCRPLLGFEKADVRAYATAAGLAWHDDPSNRSLVFARNRVRNELLPLLESIRPGSARRFARFFRQNVTEIETPSGAVAADLARLLASPDGCVSRALEFERLRAAILELLADGSARTTQAHWEAARRQLALRHATGTGGGPTKTIQFPGGHHLTFRGRRVYWEVI